MQILSNLLFIALLTTAITYAVGSFNRIYKNIKLGKPENRSDQPLLRFKTMFLVAFGQKKMFDRPVVALLHLVVYAGFLIINIELLEIVIDGAFGTHRVFLPVLGNTFYSILINVFEVFALLVIIACVVFLIRRNVLKVGRFASPELKNWPFLDANIILWVEITLMCAFLTMNAADLQLQTKGHPHYIVTDVFIISGLIAELLANLSIDALIIIERAGWWVHIIGIMLFLNYLPYSKHLHILLAFPNTYFSNLKPAAEIKNMDSVTNEVKSMLGITAEANSTAVPDRFGAKEATDLTWKNLLEAYTCTECGRCTSVCPANLTGKKLSPRKIMMDTRDRIEEIGRNVKKNTVFKEDGKNLLGHYITDEEIWACTTCNACVDACPVNISPVDIIIQLRRYKVMEESQAPQSWNMMFQNMEVNASPWKFSAADRANWANALS